MPAKTTRHVPVGELPPPSWVSRDVPAGAPQQQALWNVIRHYTGYPPLIAWIARFIRDHDLPERDPRAFVETLLRYVQEHVQFVRERPERFASPLRTLEWGIGDCDDKAIVIATVLRSLRIPVRLKFLTFEQRDPSGTPIHYSHVYPEVKLNGAWLAMESVRPMALGEDPAHAAQQRGLVPIETAVIGP
jgi:transglutaminase-like putative cysteine protease